MIAIYGANGFIGRTLVRALAARGSRLRAVSRRFDPGFTARFADTVEFVEADFTDPLAMVSTLQDVTTVVQLISTSSPGLQNLQSISDIRDNVIPHVGFLQSCVEAGISRYVFLSSGGAVYGPHHPTPIGEDAETNPISSHGLTKLTVEKYIRMHAQVDGLDFIILRPSNLFGPGQTFRKGQGLIPAIVARHLAGRPIRIIGDGKAQRDYLFIDDAMEAVTAAIEIAGPQRQILNVGSGTGRTILDVVEAIEEITGWRLERAFAPSRPTDVDTNILDVARAERVLGWKPRTAFRLALQQTLSTREQAG